MKELPAIAELREHLSVFGRADTTIDVYTRTLRQYLELSGEARDRKSVDRFLARKGTERSRPILFQFLKSCFKILEWEFPYHDKEKPKVEPYEKRRPAYSSEDAAKIVNYIKSVSPMWHTIFQIIWVYGVRRMAICKMKVEDFDLDKGTLRIPSVKGGRIKIRNLNKDFMTHDVMEAWKGYRNDQLPYGEGWMFPNRSGKMLKPRRVNITLFKVCKAIDVDYKGPHAFRRHWVTALWRAGMRERLIAQAGDWKDPERGGMHMVATYIQPEEEEAESKFYESHPAFKEAHKVEPARILSCSETGCTNTSVSGAFKVCGYCGNPFCVPHISGHLVSEHSEEATAEEEERAKEESKEYEDAALEEEARIAAEKKFSEEDKV